MEAEERPGAPVIDQSGAPDACRPERGQRMKTGLIRLRWARPLWVRKLDRWMSTIDAKGSVVLGLLIRALASSKP